MDQIITFLDTHALKITMISVVGMVITLVITWMLSRGINVKTKHPALYRFRRQLAIASIATFIVGIVGYVVLHVF
jgi:hypothetical protein